MRLGAQTNTIVYAFLRVFLVFGAVLDRRNLHGARVTIVHWPAEVHLRNGRGGSDKVFTLRTVY